nr:L-carnitine CoA-transferase [uncultured Bacillus sp.]
MTVNVNTPAFGPLQGLKVVFSAREVAGAFGPQMMAEWGAEVIWIEHPVYEDSIRAQLNYSELDRRNEHSLSMNVFSDEGREAFLKLIEDADIFVESSKGPSFARHGITDELLWEHNRALVIAHVTGWGLDGHKDTVNLPAYDLTAQAFSGYLLQNGTKDQPTPAFPYAADYFTALMVLGSSLAALYRAKSTGEGESIDIAMHEVILRMGQYYMMDYFNGGITYPRADKGKDPTQIGCGIYKCKDGKYIALELVGNKQVKAMFNLIGMGHLIGTEEYPDDISSSVRADTSQGPLLEEKLDEYFLGKTIDEAEQELAKFSIAALRVNSYEEIVKHPHVVAREDLIEWETLNGQNVKGPNVFPKFKKNPGKVWRPMPERGMDTEAILGKLGYSSDRIQEMSEKGAIKVADSKKVTL